MILNGDEAMTLLCQAAQSHDQTIEISIDKGIQIIRLLLLFQVLDDDTEGKSLAHCTTCQNKVHDTHACTAGPLLYLSSPILLGR